MKVLLSGGCFWCVEAIFSQLKHVKNVISGYATIELNDEFKLKEKASWQKEKEKFYYSSAYHNKIEVVEIEYEAPLALKDILMIHYFTHNPTLTQWGDECMFPLNRSGIFLAFDETNQDKHFDEEIKVVQDYLKMLEKEMIFVDIINNPENKPISVELFLPNQYSFLKAEEKQQNYYQNNPTDGYCTSIISPKIDKMKLRYLSLLK